MNFSSADVSTNYHSRSVNSTTGVITARPNTVTAATNSKASDGTTSAAATPTITGSLAVGDTGTFTETYDTRAVGTGKTLAPAGTVKDSDRVDVTANYNISLVNSTTGVITARPIAVTAATNSKAYDGTTSAAATPTITGSLAVGDTGTFTETYDTRAVGTGKTLAPAGTVKDSGSVDVTANYNISLVNSTTGVITARPITVTAATDSKHDGTTTRAAATMPTTGRLA